jgi:hypothetical protein
VLVVFAARHLEQLARVPQLVVEPGKRGHYRLERFAFLAQLLGALVVIPDGGIFDELGDFGEPLLLGVEVKDTSAALPCV